MLCSYLTKQAQPACSACLQMNHIFMTPHVYTERVCEVVRVCRERRFWSQLHAKHDEEIWNQLLAWTGISRKIQRRSYVRCKVHINRDHIFRQHYNDSNENSLKN